MSRGLENALKSLLSACKERSRRIGRIKLKYEAWRTNGGLCEAQPTIYRETSRGNDLSGRQGEARDTAAVK
jgi:hypothetical protein